MYSLDEDVEEIRNDFKVQIRVPDLLRLGLLRQLTVATQALFICF